MEPTISRIQGEPTRTTAGGLKVWELRNEKTDTRDLYIVYAVVPPGASEGPHTRDSEEIIFYVKGTSEVKVEGGKTYRVGPNELISIPAGISHSHSNPGKEPTIQCFVRAEAVRKK